ncbi:MAG: ATP-binding cassette domain-containing protein, partial [Victivallaceae bacterium]|nr:ATP-binding cassette domain-containing protein [Victivallaceae bacterium]
MSEYLIKLEQVCKQFRHQNILSAGVKHLLLQFPNYLRREHELKYHKILKNVSLDINRGESVGFIGENGVGKSTLLRIIAGVMTPTSGEITVNER